MTPLPEGRREVRPSRDAMGERRRPSFGPGLNLSVPISFGLPLLVVGLFLCLTAVSTGRSALWIAGIVVTAVGALLFASGKRL